MAAFILRKAPAVPHFIKDDNPRTNLSFVLSEITDEASTPEYDIPENLLDILKVFKEQLSVIPEEVLSTIAHYHSSAGYFISMPIQYNVGLSYLSLGVVPGQREIFLNITSLEGRENNDHAKEVVGKDFVNFLTFQYGEHSEATSNSNDKFLRHTIRNAGLPAGLLKASELSLQFSDDSTYLQDVVRRGFESYFKGGERDC